MKYSDYIVNTAANNMPNGLAYLKVIRDPQGKVIDCLYLEVNSTFALIIGKEIDEIKGNRFTELCKLGEHNISKFINFFNQVMLNNTVITIENFLMNLNKCLFMHGYKVSEDYLIIILVDKNNINGLEDICISELEKLVIREQQYRMLVNTTQDIMYSYDAEGRFTAVNLNFCAELEKTEEEIIGKKIQDLVNNEEFIKGWNAITQEVMATKEPFLREVKQKIRGKETYYRVNITPIFDLNGNIVGMTGSSRDITGIKESEKVVEKMAYYDLHTNLANRRLFMKKLSTAIEDAKEHNSKFAYIFIDIDNFKRVNDTYGHSVGDMVLVQLANIIENCIQKSGLVGRLSGDEFSILLLDINNKQYVEKKLDQLLEAISKPISIGSDFIVNTVSMGVAIFPDDAENAADILKNSDVAMYKSKDMGKNTYQFFDNIMKSDYIKKLNIEKLLREALINNEFVLAYQPQYTSDSKTLRGFEALIRWHSKKLGVVSPADFIPIAEETGIIYDIGGWVIEQACRDAKYFVDRYGNYIKIAVNISPKQIMRQGFLELIKNALIKAQLNPRNLEIEITENILIENFEYVVNILNELRRNDISISLDDFGTGYSSLRYLQRLPLNLLKIDKSFVDQIDLVNKDKNLVDSIIALAHTLGMETLAEGVETKEQLQYLTSCNCGNIQGYYLAKPMYRKDIENIIKNHKIE